MPVEEGHPVPIAGPLRGKCRYQSLKSILFSQMLIVVVGRLRDLYFVLINILSILLECRQKNTRT